MKLKTESVMDLPVGLVMFTGGFGGMERVVLSLAKVLSTKSIPVYLYVILEKRSQEKQLSRVRKEISKLPIDVHARILTTRVRYSKDLCNTLALSFFKDRLGIVHCHCYKSAFYLSKIKKQYGKNAFAVLLTVHGLFLKKSKLGSLAILIAYYYALIYVDIIILCASHLIGGFKYLPWLKVKTKVIENCLPSKNSQEISKSQGRELLSKKFDLDSDALWVANIGRIAPEKNFSLFIKIVAQIKPLLNTNKPVQFLIVGNGPLKESLQSEVQRLGLESDIKFTGFVNEIDLFYSTIDIFMMTSNTEGTSMALLEALRAKIPVVVTAVGGNTSIINSGTNGLLFSRHNQNEGCETLMNCINNGKLRADLRENGFKTWSEKYSSEIWVAKHLKVYAQALGKIKKT